MSDTRIEALEEIVAHQQKTIDELSEQLNAQWKALDAMRRSLERLGEHLTGLEDRTAEAAPVTKPPHY
ncbi:SlyX family protein [Asticcacaulis sp. EMRT-3]|uniref:SlyX family protein n=1 Tax=Asticcacaulis sp. EMRT-3 TaxID=3040349 RepID=UPI0024AFC8EB|nr:SlyX family protein [Asticcacaulis sp. EMRT-3]MDI7775428.1 SlyX family protein [Asticcacaulis sp. EMRT-3]